MAELFSTIYPRIASDDAVPVDLDQLVLTGSTTPASTGAIAVQAVNGSGVLQTVYIPCYAAKRA